MGTRTIRLHRTEHDKVVDKLSAYMDGQLGTREQARVEAHLAECAECREDLRSLRWSRDLLRQALAIPVPSSFVVREADLAPQRDPRRRPLFAAQWATAIVSLLFVLVLAGDLLTGGGMMLRQAAPAVLESEAPTMQAEVAQIAVVTVEAEDTTKELYTGPYPEAGQPPAETIAPSSATGGGGIRGETEKGEAPSAKGAVPEAAVEAGTTPDDRAVEPREMPAEGTPMMLQAEKAVAASETPGETHETAEAQVMAVPEKESVPMAAVETLTVEETESQWDGEPVATPTPVRRGIDARGLLRGAELGLGVLLAALVVCVIVLRRR